MTVSKEDCKKAIVDWINKNPGHIEAQFCEPDYSKDTQSTLEFEAPARTERNWTHMLTEEERNWSPKSPNNKASLTLHVFDCTPYDDQLRAYVFIKDGEIRKVEVTGE